MSLLQRILQFLFGGRAQSEQPSGSTSTAAPLNPTASLRTQPSGRAAALGSARSGEIPDASTDPYFSAAPVASPLLKPTKAQDVDAKDYLPVTREEIKSAARGGNLLANSWFGRRDLIPPADDPRTKLIDRALVTHGFLSPEQLHQIHEVGALMDQLRPTFLAVEHHGVAAGEAAIQTDREAHARLKAQKKAEAAQRKEQRKAAIAARRQSDIQFLGRGVSGRLGDRRSNLEALAGSSLPQLSTPAELATALGLSIPRLRWLAFHTEAATRIHYVQFNVPKRSGGMRTLSAPHRSLALAQRWVLREIVDKIPVEEPAHGFRSGRSIVSNATPHSGRALVVNLDLRDFFPSIGLPRVRSIFQRLGYSPAVATILALLCTESPRRTVIYDGVKYFVATGPRGLPQGACTSPGLSNLAARRFDKRLSGLAVKLALNYTRYADDLTFSGDAAFEGKVGYLLARVRHIAQDERFIVNEPKTRVLRQHTAQLVTGLVVNNRPGVRRSEVRHLRAILHRARVEGLEKQNRDGRPDFLAWLRGKIAFVEMARPEAGAKLRAELASLSNAR